MSDIQTDRRSTSGSSPKVSFPCVEVVQPLISLKGDITIVHVHENEEPIELRGPTASDGSWTRKYYPPGRHLRGHTYSLESLTRSASQEFDFRDLISRAATRSIGDCGLCRNTATKEDTENKFKDGFDIRTRKTKLTVESIDAQMVCEKVGHLQPLPERFTVNNPSNLDLSAEDAVSIEDMKCRECGKKTKMTLVPTLLLHTTGEPVPISPKGFVGLIAEMRHLEGRITNRVEELEDDYTEDPSSGTQGTLNTVDASSVGQRPIQDGTENSS